MFATVVLSQNFVAGQCLRVKVLDSLDAPVPNAAIFCDLGAGPHPIIVSAPIFQITEELVHQSEGEITIKLQLRIAGEELIVVGSRAKPRSVTESTVPVDVIRTEDFTSQGSSDLANQLRTVVPSFSVSIQPISDAATIVRPANLRNLAPDHTLILVNGKRRHRAAVITWLGNGVADGSQGPDLSVIPSIAIRQAEVLRDGAAAQYGSDAIAGVMNFQLKDSRSGGSLEFRTGVYRNANPGSPSTCGAGIIGDIQHSCNGIGGHGQAFTFAGNVGLPLGSAGFVNLSLEYGSANPTNRSIQREDAQAIIAAGNTNLRNPAQIWGSPKLDDDLKLFVNFGYPFENGLQFYPSCDGNCEGISGSSRKHSLRRPPAPARSVPKTLPSRYGGPLPPPLNHPIYRHNHTVRHRCQPKYPPLFRIERRSGIRVYTVAAFELHCFDGDDRSSRPRPTPETSWFFAEAACLPGTLRSATLLC